ncbi:hypothetical protein [Erythrobacter crassostreae]|uniref:Uncharacterized protein n=1 Tax=Erythrobacter crassostreae TaxID=2828328 RepID=A0A9X1F363_9SPHN|nr:hypothetical protein [Erythrobacter crassostrea]MBV7258829.1 hypothetical protein [Erythrobacter crassostrea]
MTICKLTLALTAASIAFAPVSLAFAHEEQAPDAVSCDEAPMIGKFDPTRDLLIANYDSKPDVDDLQAVAGLGTMLADPAFACVRFIATAGAYGTQGGEFIPAAKLFNLAFGKNWVDAHGDRDAAVARLTKEARAALEAGGRVWITEAGQSDVSAAAIRGLREEMWGNVHLVQHSDWNEKTTSEADIYFVRRKVRYHRISDGNFAGNGTPSFATDEAYHWPALLNDPVIGPIWIEAKRLSDLHNPTAAYVNPAVSAGGLDFSDTVEPAYVFGYEGMAGVGDFVERFARRP